jgi:hypothetical protein
VSGSNPILRKTGIHLARAPNNSLPAAYRSRLLCCCSGSFLKREGRPRDDDVLVARLVDRPIRPMFEKGWCNETQVTGVQGVWVGNDWGGGVSLACVCYEAAAD